MKIYSKIIRHKIINLLIRASDEAILGIDFMPFVSLRDEPNALTNALAAQLEHYLDGKDADFSPFVLDFARELSPFALQIYQTLPQISYAQRWPHKELGFLLRSRAYQAIAAQLAKNPFLIALPTHRIVRSDETLAPGWRMARTRAESPREELMRILREHESRIAAQRTRSQLPNFTAAIKFKYL